ncbi:L-asparaginase, thermolabile [Rothia mucilaginosa ATCC 25296]|uniref:asparaginase n=1 Tax=Rothia mucilaginosa TaxID=43675 RepID=UPI0001B0E7F9|nr:asparaginase [Rothia mucilaginosa]EET75247.1 L-asparaginase, thermolabile [Rothia mucilaginosa ATCC 25296]
MTNSTTPQATTHTTDHSSAFDVELAQLTRNNFVEARHRGRLILLGPDGDVQLALGDIHEPFYLRSAAKPLQAIGSMKAGAPLRGSQVAIACGSHRGTFEQMRAVQDVLTQGSTETNPLTPANLALKPTLPSDKQARQAMVQANLAATALAHPCSGKHAAFLWACTAKLERGDLEEGSQNWTLHNYLDPAHPLQQVITEEIEAFTGEPVAAIGVDGCGAPVHAVSLAGAARAYSTLGAAIRNLGADARASTVATAMVDYPELIQAPGSPDTVLSEELDAIVKGGAEGVLCIGLRSGASVVVKMSDGSPRAMYAVALRALAAGGYLSAEECERLLALVVRPVTGGYVDGKPVEVGELRVHEELFTEAPEGK